MSKSRIKINLPTITTREEAETVMNDLANIAVNQRKLVNRRDAEVLAINSKYESGLAECALALAEKSETLRAWAEATPDCFPKGRKSLELVSGTIGFRTGTPKLALLSRAWNWDKVLTAVQTYLPAFIRSTPAIDKEALLGQRDEPTLQMGLKMCGMKVNQDESFFVEPKLTEMEARQTVEA